jgi:hypothetical protein
MKTDRDECLYNASADDLKAIRAHPGLTSGGQPFDWYVQDIVNSGKWRLERVRADALGLKRPGRPQDQSYYPVHCHLPARQRLDIYSRLLNMIRSAWSVIGAPIVALCKEPHDLWRELGLDHDMCGCEQ